MIALDYATGAIKWILGDTTKQWYQFQSLRNFALTLDTNTLPPIGEHALSITTDDNLLLFDNGRSSLNHTRRGPIAPTALLVSIRSTLNQRWRRSCGTYPNGQAFYSPFCSSIYEDAPLNYLVDYAYPSPTQRRRMFAEILGLGCIRQ